MIIYLSQFEQSILFRQNPKTRKDGGWQSLLVKLQKQTNLRTGIIYLTPKDIERIHRYAFKYGNGGWEDRLTSIFGRTLGPRLLGNLLVMASKAA